MKLWLIERDDRASYGQFQAFVIRAENHVHALGLAVARMLEGDYRDQACRWMEWSGITCREITTEGDPGVILVDYIEE